MAAFLPIPFGAVDEWAIFVFEAGTAVLFALYLLGGQASRKTGDGIAGTVGNAGPGLRSDFRAFPAALKVLLGVFFAVAVIQVIPLPSGIVAVLSPRVAALRGGMVELGLGEARWATLSIASALSRGELVKYAAYALFAFIAYRSVRTRREVETIVMAVGAAAVFEAAYGLVQVFGGTEMIFSYHKKWGLGSATGTYINRNHFAGFLEMAFPLVLGLLLAKADFFSLGKRARFRERILWFGQEKLQKTFLVGLMAAVIGLGLVFSRSRSGVLIFLLTVCVMVIALSAVGTGAGEPGMGKPGRRGRKLVRTVGLVVVLAAAVFGLRPVIDRFTRERLVLEDGRAHFFRVAGRIVREYPLAGTGNGTFALAYPMFEDRDLPVVVDHAHNDYLESAAESGLVGAAALWLFFYGAFGLGLARWAKRRDPFVKGVGLGCLGGVAALLLHSLTDFNLRIPANAAVFCLLIALLMRVTALESRRQEREGVS